MLVSKGGLIVAETGRSARERAARIIIVEDHPIVRHGLRRLIETQPDLKVCGEAAGVLEACERVEALHPDVILVDLALKDSDGMDLIRRIHTQWVGVKMIVVSTYEEATHGPKAITAGAMGFVSKHEAVDQIIDAIRCVLGGKIFMKGAVTNSDGNGSADRHSGE